MCEEHADDELTTLQTFEKWLSLSNKHILDIDIFCSGLSTSVRNMSQENMNLRRVHCFSSSLDYVLGGLAAPQTYGLQCNGLCVHMGYLCLRLVGHLFRQIFYLLSNI
jgi:hypothetical protein